MIILIIMLLFAVAADLLIMVWIYKKVMKVNDSALLLSADKLEAHDQETHKKIKTVMIKCNQMDRRIDSLCREIDSINNKRIMPDLPFPEVKNDEEIPNILPDQVFDPLHDDYHDLLPFD